MLIQAVCGVLQVPLDTGIDLVAADKDGKFCAIQCKLYKENSKVSKSEIDSFLSASC
jgi:predicted helicase